MWSDVPSRWKGVSNPYASITFAYSKPDVLFFLGEAEPESKVEWLKSAKMATKAFGCCGCSHADNPLEFPNIPNI